MSICQIKRLRFVTINGRDHFVIFIFLILCSLELNPSLLLRLHSTHILVTRVFVSIQSLLGEFSLLLLLLVFTFLAGRGVISIPHLLMILNSLSSPDKNDSNITTLGVDCLLYDDSRASLYLLTLALLTILTIPVHNSSNEFY